MGGAYKGTGGVEWDGSWKRGADFGCVWWWIEIKGLDGERKALVYDNYSKLITATETIRKVSGWVGFVWMIYYKGRALMGAFVC